jgi:hypothetical protein
LYLKLEKQSLVELSLAAHDLDRGAQRHFLRWYYRARTLAVVATVP